MTPNSVPGNVSGWPPAAGLGMIVLTYCFACRAVDASKAVARKLRNTSTTTPAINSRQTIPPTMNLARFNTAVDSGSDMSGISFGERRRRGQTAASAQFEPSMGAGIDHGHEEQG